MIYLLLILFPLVAAAGSFLLRRDSTLVHWIGAATLAAELFMALSAPIDQPAQLLQVSISYTEFSRLVLATFCLGALAADIAGTARAQGEYFVATLLLIVSLAAAIMIVQEPFVIANLLVLAGLVGGLQLVDQPVDSEILLKPRTIGMALKYTLLVALGGVLLLIGFVLATAFTQQLAENGPILLRAVFGLLLIGFSLRVALIPFHVWLPDLGDETPPATLFVHVGLLTTLAVPVLLVALQTQPQLLVGNEPGRRLLLGLGLLSAVGGGLASLASNTTRRVIVYLAIANLGLIATGLGLASVVGVSAALLTTVNHVLGTALIMLGLTLLEHSIAGRREQAGAMRERPFAALSLLLGTLLLVGVPPLSGFVPKLMLLNATTSTGWLTQLLVGSSFILSSLAAARMLRRVLLLPPETPTTRSLLSADVERLGAIEVPYASRSMVVIILMLALVSVVAGIWPQPIARQVDDFARSLPFITQ